MSGWYHRICADITDLPDCITHFESEYNDARSELSFKGKRVEQHGADLPGLVEYRFNQLQEIEAILEFLNIELRKLRSHKFKHYIEAYNKTLSSRDAEKYIDGESTIVDMMRLVNEFAMLRNKFLGIIKGLDQKSWMIGHIIRLRIAGLDDAQL